MFRIKEIRTQLQLTQADLARELHLTNKAVSTYKNGTALPKLDTLIAMSRLFNCSLDYLCGNEGPVSSDKSNLLSMYNSLSDENKKNATEIIATILKNQKEI